MRIATKHFGFIAGRYDVFSYRQRRDAFWVRIAFAHKEPVHDGSIDGSIPYKYWAGFDLQLLPNFIWSQDVIRQDPRVADVQVHARIIGIQSWSFLRFCGGLA